MRYLFISLTFFLTFCSQDRLPPSSTTNGNNVYSITDTTIDNDSDEVYVCISTTAYAYHKNRDCKGLRKCTHQIKSMTEKIAKTKYRRKACGWCSK